MKTSAPKLEPALDRVRTYGPQDDRDKMARLQTAVDRQKSPLKRTSPSLDIPVAQSGATAENGREEKTTKRARLEVDFQARQKETADETSFSPKIRQAEDSRNKFTKTVDNVWAHIQQHPDGIVAKTMKSMTNFNENYKKYIRPDAVKGLTDKLLFKDESLSKSPSIYKQNAMRTSIGFVTPSYDVLKAEREQQQRKKSLETAAQETKKEAETKHSQISGLATEIQAIYESEHGPIDAEHRQLPSTVPSGPQQQPSEKVYPLSTATVKPGVVTNPVIDLHVTKFEPKFAELVDSAKKMHVQLRDIKTETQGAPPGGTSTGSGNKRNDQVYST